MKVVFFDGYCTFCNTFIDCLIRIDQRRLLRFASLQGETAAKLLPSQLSPRDSDTVIYFRDGKIYEKSTAVLQILSDLGGVGKLARLAFFIPRFIRDFIYCLVAKNRYRFFKKRRTCRLPNSDELDLLLP